MLPAPKPGGCVGFPMSDRCTNCDREACDLDAARSGRGSCACPGVWCEHWQRVKDAKADCAAHTVNWRTRAKEAEAREAWVPVTELLPEDYHMAIVYSKGRILVLQKWPQLWSGDDEIAGSVTHWRPLPEPPKGEP